MAVPSLSVSTLNTTFGALLLGGFFSTLLYGVLCCQCAVFFQRFPKERPAMKLYVWVTWILATLHTALGMYAVYSILVLGFGNYDLLTGTGDIPWPFGAYVLVTTISNALVGMMFIYRVWILSRRNKLILFTVLVPELVTWGSSLALAVEQLENLTASALTSNPWLYDLRFSFLVVADVYIAALLCYFLHAMKTSYRRTSSIIHVMMAYAVNTGLLTSILAIAFLITHATMPLNLVDIGINLTLAGSYENAILGSLNARGAFKNDLSAATVIPLDNLVASNKTRHTNSASERPVNHAFDTRPGSEVVFLTTIQARDLEASRMGENTESNETKAAL